jgi:hypothetical protein
VLNPPTHPLDPPPTTRLSRNPSPAAQVSGDSRVSGRPIGAPSRSEGDEDASWAQTYTGTDRRAGLTAAEQRRRVVRNRKAVAKLLEVIPDKDLKAEIRSSAVNRPAGGPGLTTDANVAHPLCRTQKRFRHDSRIAARSRLSDSFPLDPYTHAPHGATEAARPLR